MRRRPLAGLLLAALLAGCGAPADEVSSGSTTTDAPGAGWKQLPASPLSPRGRSVLVDLGEDGLLVVGGDMMADCHDMREAPADEAQSSGASSGPAVVPAAALSCAAPETDPRLRDGAILESATGEWKPIADAPAPLSDLSRGVVIGGNVYFWSSPSFAASGPTQGTWMAYHLSEGSWRELADPPIGDQPHLRVVKAGSRLIAYRGTEEHGSGPDLLYDPEADSWTELPTDPLSPSFDRFMVWSGTEVVLLGHELVPNPGSERPTLVRAASFNPETEQWRRLPDSEILGGSVWWWSGKRVVKAARGTSDGGEVGNYGRHYPHGGMLDLATGEWSAVPESEISAGCEDGGQSFGPDFGYQAAGPETVVNGNLAFHVSARTWEPVPCNESQADFAHSSTWAFDGLVVFGGYDALGDPTQSPADYEFSNATWIWRPAR